MTRYKVPLNCITVAELSAVRKYASSKRKQFTFQTPDKRIINTKDRFFEAANHSFPLDPGDVSHVWDALEDSLFHGLLSLGYPNVDVIWPFADDVAASSMRLLVDGIRFFGYIAYSVDRDDLPRDGLPGEVPVTLRLLLVCSNRKRKNALEKELWYFL